MSYPGATSGPRGPGAAAAIVGAEPTRGMRRHRRLRDGWIFGVLVAVVIGFSIASPYFLTRANWLNTSSTATELLLVAAGETFVIISGGIDLSVGAILGLSGMAGAWVMANGFGSTTPVAMVVLGGALVALAVGAFVGLINGVLIARYKIPPFVVTLGTLGIATGAGELISNGLEISNIPPVVGRIGITNLGGWIPVPFLIAAVISILAGLLLAKTRFGAFTYTIGDNQEAALRAGIPVRRHLVKVYVLTGVLSSIAGLAVMARLAAAAPTSGSNDNLDAIAAVVIGGSSLFGGNGTIFGTVVGTAIITVLLTGLIILNVPPFWQLIAVGIVLIGAVYVDQVASQRQSRGSGGIVQSIFGQRMAAKKGDAA